MKKYLLVWIGVLLLLFTSGCSDSAELSNLSSMQSTQEEAQATNLNMSTRDRESVVYAQVSDRQTLDLTLLDGVSPDDVDAVKLFMDRVNSQLIGEEDPGNGVLDKAFVDYILFEMKRTPYYWGRESMDILGVDPSSKSIIVDVHYSTSNVKKPIVPDNSIVRGEPYYKDKMETRYNRWIGILNNRSTGRGDWETALADFKRNYGDPGKIMSSQVKESPSETMFNEGVLNTYNNMVSSREDNQGATMTIRYVLTPKYTLGVNLGLEANHVYTTSYSVERDPLENREVYTSEGVSAILDEINDVMYRCFRSIDSNNHEGIYSLYDNYGSADNYFEDYFEHTYRNYGNFTLSLYDISGTELTFGVNLSRRVRAKGSEMTFPVYNEKYFYRASLVDDSLKILDEVLIESEIDGEPVILLEEADVAGFGSATSLSVDDRRDLETLIAELGVVQLAGDRTSDNFGNLVDLSLSTASLNNIKENLDVLEGYGRKAIWLNSYLHGHSNFASIRTRELYQDDSGKIVETEGTYEFANRNNEWKVYSYTVTNINTLSIEELPVRNVLALVTGDRIEEFNTRVSTSRSDRTDQDDVPSVGVSFDYDVKESIPFKETVDDKEDDLDEENSDDELDDEEDTDNDNDDEEGDEEIED